MPLKDAGTRAQGAQQQAEQATAAGPPSAQEEAPAAPEDSSSWKDAMVFSGVGYGSLVRRLRSTVLMEDSADEEAEEQPQPFWPVFKRDAVQLLKLAGPIAGTNVFAFALSLISLIFVGQLGDNQLSSAVLASTVFNITGLSLIVGFGGGLEIMGGQAYGAENYGLLGLVLQQALVLSALVSGSVSIVWAFAKPILEGIGQDEVVADGAATYLHILILALFLVGFFEANNRYLMAQGRTVAVTLSMALGVCFCPLFNYLFIHPFGWGFTGAAWAVGATQGTILCILAFYTIRLHRQQARVEDPQRTWRGWSRKAFSLQGWGTYMKFALPAMAMTTLQWWAYEGVVLMSGYLPDPDTALAAVGIVMNISSAFFMLVLGLSTATTITVGTSLGAGRPVEARRYMITSLLLLVVYELVCIALLLGLKDYWGKIFTSDQAVIDLVSSTIPIFVLTLPGEGLGAALSGALRGAGAGHQASVAIINAITNWLVGLPLAGVFAFVTDDGVQGLWWGLVVASTLQGLLLVWFVVRVDWKESAITARQNFHLRTLRRMRNFRSMRSATGGSGGPGGSRRRRGQIEYDIPEELLVPEYEQKAEAEAAAAAAAEAVNGHANGHAAEEGGGDDKVVIDVAPNCSSEQPPKASHGRRVHFARNDSAAQRGQEAGAVAAAAAAHAGAGAAAAIVGAVSAAAVRQAMLQAEEEAIELEDSAAGAAAEAAAVLPGQAANGGEVSGGVADPEAGGQAPAGEGSGAAVAAEAACGSGSSSTQCAPAASPGPATPSRAAAAQHEAAEQGSPSEPNEPSSSGGSSKGSPPIGGPGWVQKVVAKIEGEPPCESAEKPSEGATVGVGLAEQGGSSQGEGAPPPREAGS